MAPRMLACSAAGFVSACGATWLPAQLATQRHFVERQKLRVLQPRCLVLSPVPRMATCTFWLPAAQHSCS